MISNLFAELTFKIDEAFNSILFAIFNFRSQQKTQIFGLQKEQCKVLIGLSER
jgi:hypothetical protein